MQHRQAGYRHLTGHGLELGALNAPARLPEGLRVEYVDCMSRDEALKVFPELPQAVVAPVDHVVDLDAVGLAPFPDASVDFVIANMVLDHVANPVRVLSEMFRVVRPGGHVMLSVPDKHYTQDRDRPCTSFQALADAWRAGVDRVDDEAYRAFLAVAHPEIEASGPALAAAVRRARARRESVHVWGSGAFVRFMESALALLEIDAVQVCERGGDETGLEYFGVWRLRSRPARQSTPAVAARGEPAAPSAVTLARVRVANGGNASGRAILLCGMHRSGTSVMARLLGEMGCWLGAGEDLLEAHPDDNPEGYWERRDIYQAHVDFLRSQDLEWDRVAGLGPATFAEPAAAALQERLAVLVSDLDRHRPWLLKDPRLSLLLPTWTTVVPDAAVVVAVRHPLAIAASLAATPRGIYPTAMVLSLWEKYLLRLLADLGDRPAVFVSYERLVAEPASELARLARLLARQGGPELSVPSAERIASLLRGGLRRNRTETDPDGQLSHRQAALHACLESAAAAEGSVSIDVAGWPEPDEVLASFQAAFDTRVARALSAGSETVQRQLVHLQHSTDTVLVRLLQRSGELDAEVARLRVDQEVSRIRIADLRQRLAELGEHHRRQRERADEADAERLRLAGETEFALESVRAMRASLSWRVTAPMRWLAGAIRPPRLSFATEQRLYRWYYGFPGVSHARKRAFVTWLHRRLPFLTARTQSYMLYRQGGSPTRAVSSEPRMDAARARALLRRLGRRPKISIVMPVYNTERRWLHEAVESVRRQYYPDWELCMVDDCSTRQETIDYLASLDDPRIRTLRLEENQGIARTTNAALAMATGDFIGFLDHDDVLTADALLEVVRELQDETVDLVYSDEDKMDVDGSVHGPVFKPDFSPDYLSSNNYFCHFTVASRSLIETVGGLHYGYDGAQDFDLVLRMSERARTIRHVAKVLYHWRMIPSSTASDASAKPYTWEAGRRALTDSLARRGIAGHVDLGPYPNTYHVRRDVVGEPLVSIVVPFRDEPGLLRTCVQSVLARSTWHRFELLLVDNQSSDPETATVLSQLAASDERVRVLSWDHPFNYSALHNDVVTQAKGEYLLLLNNDTEVITPGWIEALLEHAQRPEVAVAGCRLLYPDELVQHAGVVVGIGSFAGHAHHLLPADHPGYMARPHLLQNASAVTFACAMMRTALYTELGGLDAENLAVAYNDVDFCLRARERGYLVVYTPHAQLYHHESRTRGGEDDSGKQRRFAAETAWMHARHRAVIERGDPYYNVNFVRPGNSFEIDPDYAATLPP
ncbi:MAG: glycosyltransferase [Xanthomonadales bacterium]|nr:glycosyltransferase [Xanthomonadales bacterium]